EAGREGAIIFSIDETVDRIPIRSDRGKTEGPIFIRNLARFLDALGPALRGLTIRAFDIVHFQRNIDHAVAMFAEIFLIGVLRNERCRKHEADLALFEYVARTVAHAGFESGIAGDLKAERSPIIISRLLGIADNEANMIDRANRKEIVFFC